MSIRKAIWYLVLAGLGTISRFLRFDVDVDESRESYEVGDPQCVNLARAQLVIEGKKPKVLSLELLHRHV